MPKSSSKSLEVWSNKVAKKNLDIKLPVGFIEFNRVVGNPKHPNTGIRTDIFDFQLEYYEAVKDYHQVILNKSRKIGATETALRIIAYNCFDHYKRKKLLKGKYIGHTVMIVAGNKQEIANTFIQRFKDIFRDGFTDEIGNHYEYKDIIVNDKASMIEFFNGTIIKAFPAGDSVRGEANVVCVFMSETAFVNKIDDSVVYDALKPNIANIEDADFILESTPKGRRGFYYRLSRKAMDDPQNTSFHYLEQSYKRGLGKILFQKFIDQERKDLPKDKFAQEYECAFVTSGNSAFSESEVIFQEEKIDYFEDL